MQITRALLAQYVGGQMEILNLIGRYLYRGETKTITLEDGVLKIAFAWIAREKESALFPIRWVRDDCLNYAIDLFLCSVSSIGPGTEGGDRLVLHSPFGRIAIFFPPDDSKLDPAQVEGL